MKYAKTLGLGLLVAALAVTGCSDKGGTPKAETKKDGGKKESEHAHGKGPNGGVTFDLGKYHAEFTVDHDKKECTINIFGADEKTPTPVAAKELTLTTKETKTKEGKVVAPMAIKMLPKDEKEGKAMKFVGTDPGLGNLADFAGTVLGEIDGKPSQGEFKEEENDDHKHEKK
ncbi:MAG: hypothetical protein EXR99_11405 [Gemmataceae bacterium]|nr:hypothetical protein [Gemmataceae bacterium]